MKKPVAEDKHERRFPKEAYDYQDDVTKEAVDKIRQEVAPLVDKRNWKVIDGFGSAER